MSAQIVKGGGDQAEVVHSAVLEETAVFNGKHRVHHLLGHLVIGDDAALGAVLRAEEASHELRFKFVSAKGFAGGERGNALHIAGCDL